MLMFLDGLYWGVRTRVENFVNELKKDETGVSAIVATVLLILIVVLLASLFWDKISTWFSETWERIIGSDTIGHS